MVDLYLDCVGSSGGDNEYCGTQNCMAVVKPVEACRAISPCSGSCECPEAPEGYELVEDKCVCGACCGNWSYHACPDGCNCGCSGRCGYNLLAGHVAKRRLMGVGS